MRSVRSVFTSVAALALVALPSMAQEGGNSDLMQESLAAGWKAGFICSDLFVAGMTPDEIENTDLDGIYPDIDLTPHDPAVGVSRRHAIFHEQGGQWFLKDNQSTNYTVVNRQRLNPDQDYLLDDGDEIRFGRVVASFHIV